MPQFSLLKIAKKLAQKSGLVVVAGLLMWVVSQSHRPEEGMFPLNYVNMNDLKNSGMKLSGEEIFNPGKISLTNALVKVGGCTGSFISDEGLIITNHHCVYGSVAELSTVDNNYLENGFVAKTKEMEIPINMPCKITMSYEDVSSKVLEGVNAGLSPAARLQLIASNISSIVKAEKAKNPEFTVEVSEMFVGRTFVLFRYITLQDVRLVLAPPVTIGQFGGDSDNWEWPRHNGDFSMVRAYIGKDGKPAAYNKENVPYKPAKKLKINPAGTKEGDFVFIMGYPGRTFRNETAGYMKFQEDIHLKKIQSWFAYVIESMKLSTEKLPAQRLAFAGDIQSLENTEKNYRGKIQGLRRTGLVAAKYEEERAMKEWLRNPRDPQPGVSSPVDAAALKNFMEIERIWNAKREISEIRYWLNATQQSNLSRLTMAIESCKLNWAILGTKNPADAKLQNEQIEILNTLNKNLFAIQQSGSPFVKNYEERLLTALVSDFAPQVEGSQTKAAASAAASASAAAANKHVPIPPHLLANKKLPAFDAAWAKTAMATSRYQLNKPGEDWKSSSFLDDYMKRLQKAMAEVKNMNYKQANAYLTKNVFGKEDILDQWGRVLNYWSNTINPKWAAYDDTLKSLMPKYLEVKSNYKEKMFIPDANSTLRLTYGSIKRYSPNDGEIHMPYTYLDGIFEKANTRPDYRLPVVVADNLRVENVAPILKDPITGKVIVALLYNLDTTGGNSGSPVMNDKGELIGINFDRSFTATINDYAWNENYSRSIGCDIRYVLFVMKYISKADHLLNEIGIVL